MTASVCDLRKRALIIGINVYRRDPLNYCINDAQDLSATLKQIGFDINFGKGIEIGINSKLAQIRNNVEDFTNKIENNDLTLFYFAGHGLQVNGDAYLLPSDYDYDYRGTEQDCIANYAIKFKDILEKLETKRCHAAIYILDCCRKFVSDRAQKMIQSLSAIHTSTKSLIVYACAPGRKALDETKNNRNGIFTQYLLRYIKQPNRDIEEIMKDVASAIERETEGYQVPCRISSLTQKIFLVTSYEHGNNN